MTIYKITDSYGLLIESKSIIKTLSEWIDKEIENIKDLPIDEYAPNGDINFINLKNKTIDELNNVKSKLLEKDGLKQFNKIMDILNTFEDVTVNSYGIEYKEV
ncbi:hypothetical protein [Mammaliicoccus sp. E-M24]|uniref:hypothetical protein n=1 Tax=Mammaliicoccus sp. E-M24 TaxID=2898684 RepID=UPI001EFA8717|nr:hypothetical protein [Mammaliicoccus sp. E-M24]